MHRGQGSVSLCRCVGASISCGLLTIGIKGAAGSFIASKLLNIWTSGAGSLTPRIRIDALRHSRRKAAMVFVALSGSV